LLKAGRAGRKPKLTEDQLRKIGRIVRGAKERLTNRDLVNLIYSFGHVRYNIGYVARIAKKLGWTSGKPAGGRTSRSERELWQLIEADRAVERIEADNARRKPWLI
jgi:transposase